MISSLRHAMPLTPQKLIIILTAPRLRHVVQNTEKHSKLIILNALEQLRSVNTENILKSFCFLCTQL